MVLSPFPLARLFGPTLVILTTACGASTQAEPPDAGSFALAPPDAGSMEGPAPGSRPMDAGYAFDGGGLSADRFVTRVVSFTSGPCAGFGQASMPDVVYGPPFGAGDGQGGFDVVSLGVGGELVVAFDNAIVDGPGDDFVVFENSFFAASDPRRPAADLAEISVSEDGVTWATFPCVARAYPFGACAGWHPVYSSPQSGLSPLDERAGGDRYDLAAVGLARARYVRIHDVGEDACPSKGIQNLGFDLDAIVSLHAERP